MADWLEHARTLRADIMELEYWVTQSQGRSKMVLGRIADNLRRILNDIEAAYEVPTEPEQVPDWIAEADLPEDFGVLDEESEES